MIQVCVEMSEKITKPENNDAVDVTEMKRNDITAIPVALNGENVHIVDVVFDPREDDVVVERQVTSLGQYKCVCVIY